MPARWCRPAAPRRSTSARGAPSPRNSWACRTSSGGGGGGGAVGGVLGGGLFLGAVSRHYVRLEGETVMVDSAEPVEAGPVVVRGPGVKLQGYSTGGPR